MLFKTCLRRCSKCIDSNLMNGFLRMPSKPHKICRDFLVKVEATYLVKHFGKVGVGLLTIEGLKQKKNNLRKR